MGKIEVPSKETFKGNERYFEIRNCGADGCGSFRTFAVDGDTTEQEIFDIAAELHTEDMLLKEERHYPSVFSTSPHWRPMLKVIEQSMSFYDYDPIKQKNTIVRTGRNYGYDWSTKRGGLKFTIVNNHITIKYTNGVKQSSNGYKFGRVLSHSNQPEVSL